MSTAPNSNVIPVDFRSAATPTRTGARSFPGALPVGQVVSYYDRANPRKQAVVAGEPMEFGEQRFVMEDGEESTLRGSDVDQTGNGGAGWRTERAPDGSPLVLNPVEIASFMANANRAREEEAAAAHHAREEAKADMLNTYAFLETNAGPIRGHKLAAKNIRTLLAKLFPGAKFSVQSKSFSQGNSVTVSWNDGPSNKEVEAVIDDFQTCDFESVDDSTRARNSLWTELFGGARYVRGSRSISPACFHAIIQELGFEDVTVDADGCVLSANQLHRDAVVRLAGERSFLPRS